MIEFSAVLSSNVTTSASSTNVNLNPSLGTFEAAIIGLCISSLVWVIASWRLLVHYFGWLSKCCFSFRQSWISHEEQLQHIRTDGLTTKRILHVLLWSAMVVEGVAYGDMLAENLSDKLNYTLLNIIGMGILEFSTFSILTVYWFDVTSHARAGATEKLAAFTLLPLLLAIVTIAMIVINTLEAIVLLSDTYPTLQEFRSQAPIHRITLLIESSSWGIHAIIVSICGGMVYRRISSLPNFARVGSSAKRSILSKMIIPIILCSLSYALRSGWYVADYASRLTDPSDNFETGVGWWIGNVWIPTLVPSMCLLYSVRKRDREPGSIDGVRDSLLRGDALREENDPFRNFNMVFRDLDDDSVVI
ncbi:hypothetical protein HJC23_013492 [Cyclotella cryptica]|uniref:Transmembrane protein n=1 Tax=Cyclotella cryptica TaxID=29204 RepID=A0ABD3QB92_9STRA|eukprot:CCRYP_006904-RA/>CCRYP_006904-RA protein AED:0.10 eAED:0.10 QI:0/-1/0/1/-1/1/1/0/360